MLFSNIFSAPFVLLPITTLAIPTCPPQHGAQGVSVRLPPALDSAYPTQPWIPPPPSWYFKLWSMIYASNPQYTESFRNLQYDPTPIDASNPYGQVNDLTSFQLPNNNTIFTSYGVDTPHPQWPAVLDYAGTGILEGAESQYSILAWGCDSTGTPYYASYSTAAELTQTPAGIDIMSTSDEGLDAETAAALIAAMKGLDNAEVSGLAATLVKTVQDGGREGLPRVICDDYCKTNQNLLEILG